MLGERQYQLVVTNLAIVARPGAQPSRRRWLGRLVTVGNSAVRPCLSRPAVDRPPPARDYPDRATLLLVRRRDRVADSDVRELLTAREREVLLLIARGLPNKEIGAGLGVSEPTLRKIIERLRARPRKGPPGSPPPSAGAVVT